MGCLPVLSTNPHDRVGRIRSMGADQLRSTCNCSFRRFHRQPETPSSKYGRLSERNGQIKMQPDRRSVVDRYWLLLKYGCMLEFDRGGGRVAERRGSCWSSGFARPLRRCRSAVSQGFRDLEIYRIRHAAVHRSFGGPKANTAYTPVRCLLHAGSVTPPNLRVRGTPSA